MIIKRLILKAGVFQMMILSSDRPRQAVLGSAETETEKKIGRDLGREPRPRLLLKIANIHATFYVNRLN